MLSLYHADLSLVVARDRNVHDFDSLAFEEELEFIERRRDALAILSSYFQGGQKVHRPPFPKFFVPLPVPFSAERRNSEIRPRDILGVSVDNNTGMFDPLGPLQEFVSLYMDEAAAKALAPLTIPLGLAHGSIHARCLIERFRRSRDGRATLPSFEQNVLPVLNRIKNSTDQSRLADGVPHFMMTLIRRNCSAWIMDFVMPRLLRAKLKGAFVSNQRATMTILWKTSAVLWTL